jgi:UDP-N-acetyl-2-amino-2-deoxyglucuronate dehydrogenase
MASTKEPMRFAVIGIGGQGRQHLRGIKEASGAQLVAVCDVNEDAAKARGEEYGVPYFTNYEDVLKRDDVDAVGLPLPHFLHHPIALAAFQAGKHVVIEKPMAVSVRQCDEMIAAARRAGKQLTISHQARSHPMFPYLRGLLHSEDFGRMIRMVWLSGGTRTQYYYDTETWRGTWAEEGGGTLINQKVHDLDRLAYLCDLPAELSAFTSNLFHKVEPLVDTMATAALRWENGALGTFAASITDGGADISRQEYHGDNATIINEGGKWRIGQFSMPASDFIARGVGGGPQHKPPPEDPRSQLKVDVSWEEIPLPEGAGNYAGVYGALVRAARGEGSVAITPEEARNAIELSNGITLSSLRRKAVSLPLDRNEVDEMFEELKQLA